MPSSVISTQVEDPSVVVVVKVVAGVTSTAVGVVVASVTAGAVAVAVSVEEQPSSAARITVIILTP